MKKIIPLVLIFFICLGSCSEQQDFDQVRDLEVIPDLSGPIVYVETTEAIINTISPDTISQSINFDGFASGVFSDRVISGSIQFQLQNSTSKDMDLIIDFLDSDNNSLDSVEIGVAPALPERTINLEIPYGPPSGRNIDIIRNTSSLQLRFINNSDNTSVSSLPDPKLIFRSSASFKLILLE